MESTPTVSPLCKPAKPQPPPKPSSLKLNESERLTAERYFKQNPEISRQKPPIKPKPPLLTLNRQDSNERVPRSPGPVRPFTLSSIEPSSSSEPKDGISTLQKSFLHKEALMSSFEKDETTIRTRVTVVSQFSSKSSTVLTTPDSSECDTKKIIQETWASLQEKSFNLETLNAESPNEEPTNDSAFSKSVIVKNSSYLYSSDCNKKLPFKENDSEIVESSDVSNDSSCETLTPQTPSLQLSPPTPSDESEGDWVLIDKRRDSKISKLPSNTESCLINSSPHSNVSFLHSNNKSGILNSSNSSESPKFKFDASSATKLVSSTSDGDVTLRHKKTGHHSREVSWSEDSESNRNRTNSIDNESLDGSGNSVKRRISSFFESFGKGGKTKERRESSLFYCSPGDDSSQMSSDSGRTSLTSLNETPNLISNTSIDSNSETKNSLDVHNQCFDGDSNRSSISDESFDADTNTKPVDPVERCKRKCFLIANELMTSERVFIDVLKLLCYDFKKAVEDANQLQRSPVIPPSDLNKIINTLPQLLSLNEDLLKDIEKRIESWNELPKLADVIVKKGPFLKLYSSYIQNFEAQTDFLDECCEKYRKFAQVVKDFEKSDRCRRLQLKHYMLKPIQRIPQYRLLLDDYLENQEQGSCDFDDTQNALRIVCDVANHANRSIKQGDHLSKLLSIQSQLGDYEIIKPGRHFVKEGELLKLCRKAKQQRFFILLSDCLLYTTYYGSMTGLKVKLKLPLAGMKVSTSHSSDCNTEFSIITSTRSFTLSAKSQEECADWVHALQTAIKDYNSRQMTFLNKQMEPVTPNPETFKLGREAPVWIQDQRVTMCQICTAEFTLTFRRHHCRACGKVVCSACSDYKAPLYYRKFQAERVCTDCFKHLLHEFEDIESNMREVMKEALNITSEEMVDLKMAETRSSFKKIGQSSGKKIKKFIPQRLKEVTANDSGSQMSGLLLRRARRGFKSLWFVLKDQVLYAYKASEDVVAHDSVPVLGYNVEKVQEGEIDDLGTESKFLFKLVHPGQPPIVFATDTHSAERWMQALQEATQLK